VSRRAVFLRAISLHAAGRLLALTIALVVPNLAAGQEPAASPDPSSQVAATLDGEPIFQAEVERALKETLGLRPVAPELRPALLARMLDQVVQRRLVGRFLLRDQIDVSAVELNGAVKDLRLRVGEAKEVWEKYLKDHALTETTLRLKLAVELGWPNYLQRQVTAERLQMFFQAHAADYDGRLVRVSQILWKVPPPGDAAATEAVVRQAAQIKQRIQQGTLSFVDAVQQHSSGPSRQHEGDLGFVARRGGLPERVAQAAFALDVDGLSEPVVSPFGVHLLRCTAIQPGTRSWEDVRPALVEGLSQELFRDLANQERPRGKIEYIGMPAPAR